MQKLLRTVFQRSAPRTNGNLVAPSDRAGMGAVLYDDGVTFRVWAPNADQVFVAGTFNDWSPDATALGQDGDGYWSGHVFGVAAGARYKFRLVSGEFDAWRIDPYAREVTNSVGESIVVDPQFPWEGDDYRTPPWNEMVMYEMHVGTFNKPNDGPGTFDTAIEKLGYLQELGVNTVLVMPPMEFAGDVSWGYNPAHPFAVESAYGGPPAFKRFIKAAHESGIAVLLDVVYNHFGPSDISLWQFDGWSENGMGGIYFYNDWRANTPWADTRPDYGRPEVRQYIRDNALFWLEEYHLDGLRFDATAYIRNVKGNENPGDNLPEGWELLRYINDEINARQPWKITIAEDLRDNEAITAPTSAGGAGFDAQWDAQFVHPVRAAIIAREDSDRNAGAVAAALAARYNNDAFKRVIYTESHDEVANGKARVPEEIWPDNASSIFSKKRSTLGAALVFTAPGIPMIFQGQEFLEDGWFQDQKPLDWDKLERFKGIAALYRDLFALRRNAHGTTRGLLGQGMEMYHINIAAKVLAFHRFDGRGPNDSCVVVANLTSQPWSDYWIGLPAPGLWKVRFNSDWEGYDGEFANTYTPDVTGIPEGQDNQPAKGAVTIGPYSVVVLSQDA
jgi:1,4-alpha-glucan branching enzyme